MFRSLFRSAGAACSPVTPRPVSIESSEPADSKSDGPEEAKRPPLRILVAEDNPINQKMMLLLLLRLGYTPDLAPDGQKALEMLAEKEYDLVLMDLHMPIMGGLEATRQIMLTRAPDGIPRVVAVTADTTREARQACDDLGMDAFISKPYAREQLEDVIARIAA